MKHLIDICDLSVSELDSLMDKAIDIKNNPEKYSEKCHGKKLATLFFEPSTRTRLSFEAAMYELGGNVLGFSEAGSSSSAKGESVADTARIVGCYADIIAMRHPKEGAPLVASMKAGIPVINAGDGGHHHPTQTLADMLTIKIKKGGFDNLTVGLCGDLKYGRTVHSLINSLSRYNNVKLVLISPDELRVPKYVINDIIIPNNMEYVEVTSLEDAIPELDILYMTRIQRERFDSADAYERLKDSYVLTRAKLHNAKVDLCILHPLPRVNEISVDVDDDERACYFEQALNGKFMRMALILKLLGIDEEESAEENKPDDEYIYDIKCDNPRCITSIEQELPHIFRLTDKEKKIYRCIYCEQKAKNN